MAKYRFDLRHKTLLGRVQHQAGPDVQWGAAAFDALDDDANSGLPGAGMDRHAWRRAKRLGFSDAQLAYLWQVDELDVVHRVGEPLRVLGGEGA